MSDLDARVAALMALADKHASSGMQITADQFVNRKDPTQARCDHLADYEALEQAIQAELQKPSLHEAVSDQETIDAIRACHLKVTTESMIDMRRAIDSVLQGRAKPAQEEITDAERLSFLLQNFESGWSEEDNGWYSWSYNNRGELSGESKHEPPDIITCIDAAIRASKGEKT